MSSYKVVDIEGIGETYARKLNQIEIITTMDLLEKGSSKRGRERIAAETGLPESLIITWVNHADLMRLKGVGAQTSELLEAAGVDSVKELKLRNPDNLHRKLVEINIEYGLSGKTPSLAEVVSMIEQAKELDSINGD